MILEKLGTHTHRIDPTSILLTLYKRKKFKKNASKILKETLNSETA